MSIGSYIVSADPLIIHGYGFISPLSPAKELSPYLRKVPASFVINIAWTLLERDRAATLARKYHRHKRKFPQHYITMLANDRTECELLREHGVPAILCNHNAFLDERLYRIVPGEKKYTAAINSRMKPYKRIELAKEVENTCLITYHGQPQYEEFILGTMPQMHFIQYEGGKLSRFLSVAEICGIYGQSRCGLMLSAREGGCFAAAEYLLAGLPVVTTHNIGGRDTFFHEDYTVWCDPDPQSVKLAVEKAISLPISPEEIRSRAIGIMEEQRAEYRALLNGIAARAGKNIDFNKEWERIYRNKMMRVVSEQSALEDLRNAGIKTVPSLERIFRQQHLRFKRWLKQLSG